MRARRWAQARRDLVAAAAAEALAETFGLPRAPRRIEVYDNSHIQGTNAVGAMVVAGAGRLPEEPVPQVQHPLDRLSRPATTYGMMREVLTRRFKRLMDEAPRRSAESELPDDRVPLATAETALIAYRRRVPTAVDRADTER